MSHRTLLAAALGALALVAAAPDAAAWTPLTSGVPRWNQMPVGYYINQSTIPQSISNIAVARIDAGFASWSAPGCTVWETANLGNTTGSYNYNDGRNILRWISNTWPAQLGDVNSVIGVTLPVWGANNVIYDGDIVFNNVGFCWNDSGNSNCVDTQSIAVHEQGHFLGLGHSNASGATMEAFYGGGASMRTLEQDDINGVCALYPPGGTVATSSGSGGSGCQVCVNGSASQGGDCASQYNACGASQSCLDFYDCLSGCSSQACVDGCVSAHPAGAQIYSTLINCICEDCAAECSQECGGSSNSTTTSTTTSAQSTSSGGGAGGDDSGAGGSGGDPKPSKKKNNDVGADSGCAIGGSSAGLGGLLLLGALGAFASRRRRRG